MANLSSVATTLPGAQNNPQSAQDDDIINSLGDNFAQDFVEIRSLRQNGLCVLSQVLTEQHCKMEVDRMWDFFEDVSNGAVQRSNPASWQHPFAPSQGFFENFGAGFLLGTTREVLADQVFEPLYSTKKLHCSKEGFRVVVLAGSSDPPATQNFFLCPDEKNPKSEIRSLAVLSKTTVRCKLRSSTESDARCEHQVSLSRGDVLLFRETIQVEEEYTITANNNDSSCMPATMYCTMQPAIDLTTNKPMWNQKLEAYKQRQTGTYHVDQENWSPPSTAPAGRCYFRTGPPLVTRRLAELYGLIPYQSKDWNIEIQRAVIKGIRFQDEQYQRLPPTVQLPCKAKSIQLTSSDSNIVSGQDKYLGGMASPCGKWIYGVPGTARRVMRISTETGVMDCIGPSFSGKFKWLRGVEIPASVMTHEDYPDGCCIALSCNHLSFLKVNPFSSKVYTFGSEILEAECAGINGWYYHGGNLASNGWIYCIPANAKRVVKLNPSTDEVVAIGPSFEGGQKWYGGLVGSDSCIYGIPHNSQGVLKIDPYTDEVTVLEGTNGPLPLGNWKWHGGLVAGDKIIGFPNNSDSVLIIDCLKSVVYTVGNSEILKSGRHRIPQDGRYKYLGGALTRDGRYAYFFPCDAERVMRIDCQTDELTLVGPCFLDGENKFQNGFVSSDGCLYAIPQRAIGVLRIVPGAEDDGGENDDLVDVIPCGENMVGVKDKFEGGVLGLDGSIYCIPLKAKECVKIIPEKL